MSNYSIQLQNYDYSFPKELIAQKLAKPRDSARLLVYNRKTNKVFFDKFRNIHKYLPSKAVLVFNETKVLPARLILNKETGGKTEILYVEKSGNLIKVMADRKLNIKSYLFLKGKKVFQVEKQNKKFYFLNPLFPISKLNEFLDKYGVAPLPLYIKNSPFSGMALRKEYQSVFAKKIGSIAAPTASLHFTKKLLAKLKKLGFGIEFITLHVNLGTFAPLTKENLDNGKLHSEVYGISKKTSEFLNKTKKENRPIIAVGTTVVRTLESASGTKGQLNKLYGKTDIFIKEGYKFKFIDGLITNFHVPMSSLLMLASAFAGRKQMLSMYKKAIEKKFKLFSFGDGMLII